MGGALFMDRAADGLAVPDKLYGHDIGGSYRRQGLKLGLRRSRRWGEVGEKVLNGLSCQAV